MVKGPVLEVADKLPLSASILFEITDEEDTHHYLTMSDDHPDGEGISISPCSILHMVIETWEALRSDVMFELKTQTN